MCIVYDDVSLESQCIAAESRFKNLSEYTHVKPLYRDGCHCHCCKKKKKIEIELNVSFDGRFYFTHLKFKF